MAIVISGVVVNASGPVARVVRLYVHGTGAFVDEVTSDAFTGEYEFTGLDSEALYDVTAYDPDFSPGGALTFSLISPIDTSPPLSHRYWRLDSFTMSGNLLEVSEFRCYEAGVDRTSEAAY